MRYESELADAVFELAARINSRIAANLPGTRGERLTAMQTSSIWHVAWSPGVRQLDLARQVGVTASTMSKICSRLIELELLRSEGAGDDHRARYIHLTPKGHQRADALFGVGNRLVSRVIPEFSTDELDVARRVIVRLLAEIPSARRPSV